MGEWLEMNPLSVLLIFLVMMMPLHIANDTLAKLHDSRMSEQRKFANMFTAAVDDTGVYLARLESQQQKSGVRYAKEKQLAFDIDMLNVFYESLAIKFGVEGDPVQLQNVLLHIPAMVMVRYDGYTMITLDDTSNTAGQKSLTPAVWPIRPYDYTLTNGNILYFTLDDWATVYDKNTNQFIQLEYDQLFASTNLAPITDITMFRELRQKTILNDIQRDLAGAINRHLELVQRLGLSIDFSIPQGVDEQSIKDVGFLAFVQGYPLPGGELLNQYAFGGGSVAQRKDWVGVIENNGTHSAYEKSCVPITSIKIEDLYDDEEGASKGYFIKPCS
jgi:hypothetical protein